MKGMYVVWRRKRNIIYMCINKPGVFKLEVGME